MENLKKDLQSVLKSIQALAEKIEKIQQRLDRSNPPSSDAAATTASRVESTPEPEISSDLPKRTRAQGTDPLTAFDTVVNIIRRSKKGVNMDQLKAKTGFNDKKIANILYKGKRLGKIRSEQKGIYVKA
jgi:hypothetical protein